MKRLKKSSLRLLSSGNGHIHDLSFLLKNESVQSVAIIVNYIDPDLADKTFESFP